MSFLERARERAMAATEQVRTTAGQVMSKPGAAASSDAGESAPMATSGGVNDSVRHGIDAARSSLASLVDRLDPRLVADVIDKATSIQERANAALREKGSPYRIDGISITATIPPQISFSIGRSAAADEADGGPPGQIDT